MIMIMDKIFYNNTECIKDAFKSKTAAVIGGAVIGSVFPTLILPLAIGMSAKSAIAEISNSKDKEVYHDK